jgi:hypothetical protein
VYNQPYQPSFGQQQQQQVQSQYRGLQKAFQPTGYVQSFYQQQPTSFAQSAQTQNYHTSNYVGNKHDHDAYLREDSLGASTYATGRTQGVNTLNNVQPTFSVNTPTSQFTSGFHGGIQSGVQGGFQQSQQSFQPSFQQRSFQPSNQSVGYQGTNQYHTSNYVGDRQDHDAYLREDSLRASTYATGRSQGVNTLNNAQPTFSVNAPTNQIAQQGFSQFRNF